MAHWVSIESDPIDYDIPKRKRLLRHLPLAEIAAGKSKMLIVGAAMRKLVHIIYGVLKNDRPFNPHFAEVKA